MRIVCLFNLKPDTDIAAYESWARSSEIPTANSLASVERFTVHRATSVLGDQFAKPPYDYIEVIDVESMDPFMADVMSQAMQDLAVDFQGFAEAPLFILTEEV